MRPAPDIETGSVSGVARDTSPLLETKASNTDSSLSSLGIGHCCYTMRKKIIMLILTLATLTSSLGLSLFAPYFPHLAETKGASMTVYGIILGSNCLATLFFSPLVGKYMSEMGPSYAFNVGLLINGVCCITSGYLEYMPPGVCFVTYSIIMRILHAIGNAGVMIATFTIISVEYKPWMSTIFSYTRLLMSLGQMVGPAFGGLLIEYGGFLLPFIVLGIIQCIVAVGSYFYLDDFQEELKKEDSYPNKLTLTKVLKMPVMYIPFGMFLVSTLTNGFTSLTLEPKVLRKYHMTFFLMGIVFGVKDGANTVFTLVWGWLCDRKPFVKPCLIISTVTSVVSLVILGPLPYLDIDRSIWVTTLSLALLGIGICGQQLAGVIDAVNEAVDYGYGDNMHTNNFIASMWSAIGGLGRFVAHFGSGVLVDSIGFRWTVTIIIVMHIILCGATVLHMFYKRQTPIPIITLQRERKESSLVRSTSQAHKQFCYSSEIHHSTTLSIIS